LHIPIEETELFKQFVAVADELWWLCRNWDSFAQRTIGEQLVKSVDSIGANMAEGDGRFSDVETVRFFVIARGSSRETRYWLDRARARELIPQEMFDRIDQRVGFS